MDNEELATQIYNLAYGEYEASVEEIKSLLDSSLGDRSGAEAYRFDLLCWARDKWNAEVLNRPMVNVHRRSLDDTWRTVIRKLGGDPDLLLALPDHDTIVGQPTAAERTVTPGSGA